MQHDGADQLHQNATRKTKRKNKKKCGRIGKELIWFNRFIF